MKVTFPAATAAQPRVEYRLEATAIYPSLGKDRQDRRFDSFRRNWLNIIQLNPRFRALANNSTSDTASLVLLRVCRHCPAHAAAGRGPYGLELVRQSLDRVLGGNADLRHAGLHYG